MPSAPRVTTSHKHRHARTLADFLEQRRRGNGRHHADREHRGRTAVAAAERRARGGIGRRLLLGALRGRRQQSQPQRAIGAQREDVDPLAAGRLPADEER
jgi:hypothetical protein